MNAAHASTARLVSAVLVGGFATGALLALAVPTTMKHQVDNWRERIGVRDVSVDSGGPVMFEAPPEDLTPVSWQTAGQEYPSDVRYDGPAYVPIDMDADIDAGFIDDQPDDALPAELLTSNQTSDDRTLSGASDEAGASAQAASEAASDVRAVESTAFQTANAQTSIPQSAERAFVIRDDQSSAQ